MNNKTIRPAFTMQVKPTEDLDTQRIPAIIPIVKDPITPIPPALIRPFISGALPLPPGINGSYRPGSARRPIVGTKALHQFKNDAALQLTQVYHDWPQINKIQASQVKVPLRMDIHFYFETLWKRDIDGGVKAVMDAVFEHLGLNDVLVLECPLFKSADPHNPRVEFEVCCLPR